jgi:hypothetical protein
MTDLVQETGSVESLEVQLQDRLEASVTPVAGIDCLVTSAQQTFQLVEPWYQAKPV